MKKPMHFLVSKRKGLQLTEIIKLYNKHAYYNK